MTPLRDDETILLYSRKQKLHNIAADPKGSPALDVDPDRDREDATGALLDYYQHAAARADALIGRQTRPAPAFADGPVPVGVPVLAGREQALAWARAERASVLACLDHATATGHHARVIALTAGLAGPWRSDGPWAEAITRHTAAVQAAEYLGDRLGQASALNYLGMVRMVTGDYPAAAQVLEQTRRGHQGHVV